jgi:poly(3-hydroxybutyrate) depolymerase
MWDAVTFGGRGARRRAMVALALLAACGLPPRPPDGTTSSGDFTVRLQHDGRSRRYLVHVPRGGETTPRPVVLVLHGAAGDAVENRNWLDLDGVADREGFLTVYPDGTGPFGERLHTWNSGVCCGSAQWEAVDDVGFLLAVLDTSRSAPGRFAALDVADRRARRDVAVLSALHAPRGRESGWSADSRHRARDIARTRSTQR